MEQRIMGIFDTLKNAIFGKQSQPGSPTATPQASQAAAPTTSTASAAPTSAAMQGAAGASAATPATPVDIEQVLTGMAAKKPEKLNWQSSIVDLMKLVDLDPSLSNRKELAGELGYTGDTQDSAKMNIWLHHEVMEKLAASGGKVPDSLRH
jgi:3-oxoacyl-ACP reductase-like protein